MFFESVCKTKGFASNLASTTYFTDCREISLDLKGIRGQTSGRGVKIVTKKGSIFIILIKNLMIL